jgi:hypothetical protein
MLFWGSLLLCAASSAAMMRFGSSGLGDVAALTFAISLSPAICSVEARD